MQTKIYNQTNSHVVFDISKLCTLLSSTTFSFTFLSNPQMMAHTRDTDTQLARQPDNSNVLPKPKRTTRTTAKSKTSHTANDTSTVESEQCAPAKNGKPSDGMPKRQRDVDATAAAEEKQAAPTKKPRTAPKQAKDKPDVSTRRSGRTQTKAPAAPQRRKRRTLNRTIALWPRWTSTRTLIGQKQPPKPSGPSRTSTTTLNRASRNLLGTTAYPVPTTLTLGLMVILKYHSYNRKPRKCPQKRR